jgi:hypothetical protein
MHEKHTIIAETVPRYRRAGKQEKGLILNELVALTGYNRTYAMRLLTWWGATIYRGIDGVSVKLVVGAQRIRKKRRGTKKYSPELVHALVHIGATFDCMCGKRLRVFLRENIDALRKYSAYDITDHVAHELLSISPATIDRLLAKKKQKPWFIKRHHARSASAAHYKTAIPVRTFYGQEAQRPGFLEIDTVYHSGETAAHEFCCTLTATDTMTGWVALRALPNRAHRWVKEALAAIKATLPFPLLAIDSDNGPEFLNTQVYQWCMHEHIAFTRSRAYHKNDNPFVEQKNNQYVRRFVGYTRYDTPQEFEALQRVYGVLCPLLNFFYPSTKLIAKQREGAVIHKTYDALQTPCSRVLASPHVPLEAKESLCAFKASLDPVRLRLELALELDLLQRRYSEKTYKVGLYEAT